MRAILKKPGKPAELIEVEDSREELYDTVGGAYDTLPSLFGAMALCRSVDTGLEFNCHFMGRYFYGNLLIVGRGKEDKPVDLPEHLHRILKMVLWGGKR